MSGLAVFSLKHPFILEFDKAVRNEKIRLPRNLQNRFYHHLYGTRSKYSNKYDTAARS